jgi:hypothetical protein
VQEVNVTGDLVGSGRQRGYDETQEDKASSFIRSAASVASRQRRGRRLERHRAARSFGWSLGARSAAGLGEPKALGGAPEEVEEDRRKRGMRGSLISLVLSGDSGGSYDSDDEFLGGSSMLPRNSKGGRGRAPGGIYGRPWRA